MYRLDSTLDKECGSGQEELIMRAIAMAETLVTKVETKVENRDYLPSADAQGRKIVPRLKDLKLKATLCQGELLY